MLNPLKHPVQDQTDKGDADKSTLNAGQIRTCEKCHRELPSTCRYNKCDNCRSQLAKTVAAIGAGALTITGLVVKKYGPKVVRGAIKIIAKRG